MCMYNAHLRWNKDYASHSECRKSIASQSVSTLYCRHILSQGIHTCTYILLRFMDKQKSRNIIYDRLQTRISLRGWTLKSEGRSNRRSRKISDDEDACGVRSIFKLLHTASNKHRWLETYQLRHADKITINQLKCYLHVMFSALSATDQTNILGRVTFLSALPLFVYWYCWKKYH